jgi:hypothetical protein
MHTERAVTPGRLRRLAEELGEAGVDVELLTPLPDALLDELDYALRPPVHESRVPTYGAIVEPTVAYAAWGPPTGLGVTARDATTLVDDDARRFADGLASWVVRRAEGVTDLVVFDRAAGSERDLVVLAGATGGLIVQRHPTGVVRLVGAFGVVRWDGMTWHREAPVAGWIDTAAACLDDAERDTLARLVTFAVHDLGARGTGALLIHRHTDEPAPPWEANLGVPPPLRIDRPADLAPLRHVLSQVDGAAVFDRGGTLRRLGVRLVPSAEAERDVDPLRGTRHTAGRRYSFDDSASTVIVVSEDGPVTVLQQGRILGRSAPT